MHCCCLKSISLPFCPTVISEEGETRRGSLPSGASAETVARRRHPPDKRHITAPVLYNTPGPQCAPLFQVAAYRRLLEDLVDPSGCTFGSGRSEKVVRDVLLHRLKSNFDVFDQLQQTQHTHMHNTRTKGSEVERGLVFSSHGERLRNISGFVLKMFPIESISMSIIEEDFQEVTFQDKFPTAAEISAPVLMNHVVHIRARAHLTEMKGLWNDAGVTQMYNERFDGVDDALVEIDFEIFTGQPKEALLDREQFPLNNEKVQQEHPELSDWQKVRAKQLQKFQSKAKKDLLYSIFGNGALVKVVFKINHLEYLDFLMMRHLPSDANHKDVNEYGCKRAADPHLHEESFNQWIDRLHPILHRPGPVRNFFTNELVGIFALQSDSGTVKLPPHVTVSGSTRTFQTLYRMVQLAIDSAGNGISQSEHTSMGSDAEDVIELFSESPTLYSRVACNCDFQTNQRHEMHCDLCALGVPGTWDHRTAFLPCPLEGWYDSPKQFNDYLGSAASEADANNHRPVVLTLIKEKGQWDKANKIDEGPAKNFSGNAQAVPNAVTAAEQKQQQFAFDVARIQSKRALSAAVSQESREGGVLTSWERCVGELAHTAGRTLDVQGIAVMDQLLAPCEYLFNIWNTNRACRSSVLANLGEAGMKDELQGSIGEAGREDELQRPLTSRVGGSSVCMVA